MRVQPTPNCWQYSNQKQRAAFAIFYRPCVHVHAHVFMHMCKVLTPCAGCLHRSAIGYLPPDLLFFGVQCLLHTVAHYPTQQDHPLRHQPPPPPPTPRPCPKNKTQMYIYLASAEEPLTAAATNIRRISIAADCTGQLGFHDRR